MRAADAAAGAALAALVLALLAALPDLALAATASASALLEGPADTGGACALVAPSCGEANTTPQASAPPEEGAACPARPPGGSVCVSYFWSPTCPSCARVSAFLEGLASRHPRLYVHKMNILYDEVKEKKEAVDIAFKVPEERRGSVPAAYIGGTYLIGERDITERLEGLVAAAPPQGSPCPCDVIKPGPIDWVREGFKKRFKGFSIGTIVAAGLVDSINPCAIAGLIFFISYLAIVKKKGPAVLIIGGLYSAGVFAANLSLGLWFKSVLAYAEHIALVSRLLYPATGIAALFFAAYSYRDYRRARDGDPSEMTLQLPAWAKRATHWVVRTAARSSYLAALAFLVGFFITFFEFLCTGQVYLPTIIYILGVPELRSQALSYLVAYNLLFVSPLVVVFVAAYLETTSKSMEELFREHVAGSKLLAAGLFAVLGAALLYHGAGLW